QPLVGESPFLHRLADAPFHFFDWQISKPAARPLLDRVDSDVPGDAAVVGDVQDQTGFSIENSHGCRLTAWWIDDKRGPSSVVRCPLQLTTDNGPQTFL